MWRLVVVFAVTLCVALVMSPVSAGAQMAANTTTTQQAVSPQFARYGVGLWMPTNTRSSGVFSEGAYVTIYVEPNTQSGVVGYLENKMTADDAGLYQYSYEDPAIPAIEPGFFAKLLGKKPEIQWQYAPVKDVKIGSVQSGLAIYERKAGWLRISVGWIESTGLVANNGYYISWNDIYAEMTSYKQLSSEYRAPNSEEVVSLVALGKMREHTVYMPLMAINIYSTPGFGNPITTVSAPLEFAVLEQRGMWIRVFAVVSSCDHQAGKTDYREGTIGWVSLIGKTGAPQMKVAKKDCNEF